MNRDDSLSWLPLLDVFGLEFGLIHVGMNLYVHVRVEGPCLYLSLPSGWVFVFDGTYAYNYFVKPEMHNTHMSKQTLQVKLLFS